MSEGAALRSDAATVAFEREREEAFTKALRVRSASAVAHALPVSPCFLNLAACRAPALQLAAASGARSNKGAVGGVSQAMEFSRGKRRRWRWGGRSMLKLAGLCFAAMAICLCGVRSWACSGSASGCRGSAVLLRSESWRQAASACSNQGCYTTAGVQWRRLLAEGPGSYPPRCTSKCGDCSPCYPVHVAVPPGVPVTTEYYPEAWRCKCGNRLYMP